MKDYALSRNKNRELDLNLQQRLKCHLGDKKQYVMETPENPKFNSEPVCTGTERNIKVRKYFGYLPKSNPEQTEDALEYNSGLTKVVTRTVCRLLR